MLIKYFLLIVTLWRITVPTVDTKCTENSLSNSPTDINCILNIKSMSILSDILGKTKMSENMHHLEIVADFLVKLKAQTAL